MSASQSTAPNGADLEAVILDYNGVIGRQPGSAQWTRLAELAGWHPHESHAFQQAFWQRREPYDQGIAETQTFWSGLLRNGRTAPVGSTLLAALRRADTDMWTATDPAVLDLLRTAHATGLRLVLMSNAPKPLANALDEAEWCATLFSRTVYSARIGVNKPDKRAYEAALEAAGVPHPATTLFVDDRLENVEAAEQLGLQGLHYTGAPAALARRLPGCPPPPGGHP
ncbi:HAD-IA family hydrolase [Streptomyces acidiscabies]|uniref:HAD-IA family hydrolase n=1 Tax=Streptomyces acidiscabies TaxID=42234 RepID=A0ABU4LWQ0_9ACTN|nr:HAD-IA family hydrolase [Streptomyces acidiscabies]MDX3020140.1 HAD-IA family hydrolase [Streptomyces acidiscabies]